MNLYYPSILIFVLALIVVYWLVPRFTPLIMVIFSGSLLAFGVYHHYKIFKHEYQKSTWADSLKMYAPAILIGFTIMFMLFSIFSFFSSGSVPVPSVPTTMISNILSPPSASNNIKNTSAASPITAALNAVTNTANSVGTGVTNIINNTINNVANSVNGLVSKNKKNNNLF